MNNRIEINEFDYNGFDNIERTPHEYLDFLHERTTDGLLIIPRWDDDAVGDTPTHYDCYDIDWTANDVAAIHNEYDTLMNDFHEILEKYGDITNEKRDFRNTIKEEALYNTWHTYIRPYIQSEFDDEVIEELEEREFLCGDFTTEESEMLASYEEKLREEYQSRLGGVVMQAALISRTRRMFKLLALNAPKIILENEGRFLIEAMALNKYAVSCE